MEINRKIDFWCGKILENLGKTWIIFSNWIDSLNIDPVRNVLPRWKYNDLADGNWQGQTFTFSTTFIVDSIKWMNLISIVNENELN